MAGLARFAYYQDHAGEWRWHLKGPDNKIIADSGQGYREERDCIRSINLVKLYALHADIAQMWGSQRR